MLQPALGTRAGGFGNRTAIIVARGLLLARVTLLSSSAGRDLRGAGEMVISIGAPDIPLTEGPRAGVVDGEAAIFLHRSDMACQRNDFGLDVCRATVGVMDGNAGDLAGVSWVSEAWEQAWPCQTPPPSV